MAATQRQSRERQAKVLRIGIIQDGKIVQERLIKQGESVTVGDSAKNTFVLSANGLPRKEYPLFVSGRSGYVLNFTEGMKGKISSGGAVVGLDKLRNDASVQQQAGSWRLPLTEQDRGKIGIDGVTVLFQFVPPPPTQAFKPMQAMSFRPRLLEEDDPVFLGFLAIFTALAAILVVWVWNTEAPQTRSLAEIPDRFTRLVLDPPEVEEPEVAEVEEAEDAREKLEVEEEEVAEVEEEAETEAPRTEREEKIAEAQRREDVKQELMQKSLIIKHFVTRGESSGGTAADLWDEEDKGLDDLDAAVAEVSGVKIATSEDQGLRQGGGGTSEDADIGDLGRVGGGSTTIGDGPEVAVKGQVDMGSGDLSGATGDHAAVKGVVEKYFGQLTYCYETRLKGNPDLGGRVEVEWNVTGGRVTSAYVFANTTGDQELGECIVNKIERWRFPNGVEGQILYPFIFKRRG